MIAPELYFWAAEVAKKPEGWSVERYLTVGGFILSVTLGLVTLLKFIKERRDAKEVKDVAAIKAPAEKDVIIVTGAQSAVLMMEQAAKAAREEADRYRADLDRVRTDNDVLKEKIRVRDEKIDELEDKLRILEQELTKVADQLRALRHEDK